MKIEQQLRAALAPERPGPQVRSGVMVLLAAGPGRHRTRWVLSGVVLAVAAAATMLGMQLLESEVATEVVASRPVPAASPVAAGDDTAVPEAVATNSPSDDTGPPQPAAPAVRPFTVQVLPLKTDVSDPPRKAAIEAVYVAFVDGLRAVPGLTLVEPAGDGSETPVRPDYRITLEGNVLPASPTVKSDFTVRMAAEHRGPGAQVLGRFHSGMSGELAPGCVSPPSMDPLRSRRSCTDTMGVATGLVATLRKLVFPPDPQLRSRLQARLLDQKQDAGERLQALEDLSMFGRASGTNGRDELSASMRDPAVVRAAVQLASTAPDPAARAQIWYMLRGSRDPGLLAPLVTALQNDADDDTRLQALGTLEADFAADPRTRSAFEAVARGDADPMLRALAQRALGSTSAWTDHVLASLKDAGRSPVDRVRALFHAYGLPTQRMYGSFGADSRILRALDDAAMRALTEMLPLAAADSERYAQASHTLVSELAYMKHPAITDMLLESLDAERKWMDRSWVIEALRRRPPEPRVLEALARIAVQDADPRIRELAARPLGPEEKAPTAGPPRLGVMTDYVKSAPEIPAELVGKLVVTRMGTGMAADQAGIKEGDVLLQIDGKAITSGPQMIEVLDGLPRDVDIEVLVSRNGQNLRLTARF
jgi:hypothetical protein